GTRRSATARPIVGRPCTSRGNPEMTSGDRSCGSCGLCCKLVAVEELNKPAHQWCAHFSAGRGCTIYTDRPGECRTFRCLWLMRPQLSDAWRPDRSRIVLYFSHDGTHLIANVD